MALVRPIKKRQVVGQGSAIWFRRPPSSIIPNFTGHPFPLAFSFRFESADPGEFVRTVAKHRSVDGIDKFRLFLRCDRRQMPPPGLRICFGLLPCKTSFNDLISPISPFPRIGQTVAVGVQSACTLLIKLPNLGRRKSAVIDTDVIQPAFPRVANAAVSPTPSPAIISCTKR